MNIYHLFFYRMAKFGFPRSYMVHNSQVVGNLNVPKFEYTSYYDFYATNENYNLNYNNSYNNYSPNEYSPYFPSTGYNPPKKVSVFNAVKSINEEISNKPDEKLNLSTNSDTNSSNLNTSLELSQNSIKSSNDSISGNEITSPKTWSKLQDILNNNPNKKKRKFSALKK